MCEIGRGCSDTLTNVSDLPDCTQEWSEEEPVLASQRQARILSEVQRRGAVRVSQLAELLGVSDMTIRRDLDLLAGQGLLDKVHGGATAGSLSLSTDEPGFEAKWMQQQPEKEAISRAAVPLVRPGMAIGLSAGTTTWTLAQQLRDVADLTIVTNSMLVAQVFHRGSGSNQTVILTGGVRTPSDALVGPVAVSALHQLHLDIVFLGVHGMTERAGFSTPNLLEADVNRALVGAANRLVVVTDHSKWGQVGLSSIARLDEADMLITDSGLDPDAARLLGELVGELVVVEVVETAEEPQ
jgi:DeoR/GlpR family transcriptional regulator of sugar metabolism